jgi:ubiquinone/menaquinone biosynthesis C-methylase UbiE
MNMEAFSKTTVGGLFVRTMGRIMESPLRYKFFGSARILEGAALQPGQTVLELGCGTGYFTLTAARMIGDNGKLVAMDILPESVAIVTAKVQAAKLNNVTVVKGDAMSTGLDSNSFDMILLFGVIPAPMIPLPKLLPELHRVLKPEGVLTIWPSIPGWLPGAIVKPGLFTFTGKRNGVSNFARGESSSPGS